MARVPIEEFLEVVGWANLVLRSGIGFKSRAPF